MIKRPLIGLLKRMEASRTSGADAARREARRLRELADDQSRRGQPVNPPVNAVLYPFGRGGTHADGFHSLANEQLTRARRLEKPGFATRLREWLERK